jgi:hypothetical protein
MYKSALLLSYLMVLFSISAARANERCRLKSQYREPDGSLSCTYQCQNGDEPHWSTERSVCPPTKEDDD